MSNTTPQHRSEYSPLDKIRGTHDINKLKADAEQAKKQLIEDVKSYNHEHGNRTDTTGSDMVFNSPLLNGDFAPIPLRGMLIRNDDDIELNTPAKMLHQVTKMLEGVKNALKKPELTDLTIFDKLSRKERKEQVIHLTRIKDEIINYSSLYFKIEEASSPVKKEEIKKKEIETISSKYDEYQKGQKTLETWGNKSLYKLVDNHFDRASTKKEFKSLWETPNGIEANKHTEARQLFISILAEQTDNFKNPIFFGKNFGENYKNNIKHYPFIYNEWFKQKSGINLSIEKIAERKGTAGRLKTGLKNVESIQNLVEEAQPSSGIDINKYISIASAPADEASRKKINVLEEYIANLDKKNSNLKVLDIKNSASFKALVKKFKMHLAYEEANLAYLILKKQKDAIDTKFTASYFEKPVNQEMAIELAMLKFKKAMDSVDNPLGEGTNFKDKYHPTVRRTIIASLFKSHIGRFKTDKDGNDVYVEDLGKRKSNLLGALSKSHYFNNVEKRQYFSNERVKALLMIEFGFEVSDFLEESKDAGQIMEWIIEDDSSKLTSYKPHKYVNSFTADAENMIKRKAKYDQDRDILQKFLDLSIKLLNDPDANSTKKLMNKVLSDGYLKGLSNATKNLEAFAHINGPDISEYTNTMQSIDIQYSTQELSHKNTMKIFEHLGMRLEGSYGNYKSLLEGDFKDAEPPLTIDNWNEYYTDPNKFDTLANFIERVLPKTTTGGENSFMVSFRASKDKLNSTVIGENPEESRDPGIAIALMELLKEHIKLNEEVRGVDDSKQKEIELHQKGNDIGDIASRQLENAWEMLVGSGQSTSNRIAGGILLYGLYKAARKAMKGDDPAAKALRGLFIAGAAEIFMKETTGKGILDRFGLDPHESAMEGTYEGVMVEYGKKSLDGYEIEHKNTLQHIKGIPFHKLMEWHDKTTSSGKLRNPDGNKGYKLPNGIKASDILKGNDPSVDKEQKASLILRKTMDNFFTYVGNKDNERSYEHGLNVTKERWVTMIKDPTHVPEYTNFWSQELSEMHHKNPNELTWGVVMRYEIDPYEVESTKNKTIVGQVKEFTTESLADFESWSSQYEGKFKGGAREFFEGLGDYAHEASESIGKLIDEGATDLYFFKESMKLKYKTHKYTIKRTLDEHWQIVVEGATLPFKLIYAVDKKVMPAALTKIQQIESVLSNQREIEIKQDLSLNDIVSNTNTIGIPNVDLNPEYSYFGEYQIPFKDAFNSNDKYHEDPEHIGYYISEINLDGVNSSNELYNNNPNNVRNKMLIESRDKAIKFFKNKGGNLSNEQIEKYLYKIHVVNKTTYPQKMYIFWRLPMHNSAERNLKDSGRWADHNDPNRIKKRAPWKFDPKKDRVDNFLEAMRLDTEEFTGVIGDAASYAIQLPYFAFGTIDKVGEVVAATAKIFTKDKKKKAEIDRVIKSISKRPSAQKRWLDEVFTSAQNPTDFSGASSEFYKDPVNAKLYKFSLEFSRHPRYRGKFFTGLLEGRPIPDEKGKVYKLSESAYGKADKKAHDRYNEMAEYYYQIWGPINGGDPDIAAAILSALAR